MSSDLPKLFALVCFPALLVQGCAVGESSSLDARAKAVASPAPVGVVDSSMSIDEGLRRFREGLPGVSQLAGGERSREALVRRFVHALERSDTNDLRAMAITRSEFAYLYYPTSAFTRPPTLQVAGLVWFFNIQSSQKGLTRAMRRFGGKPIGYFGHSCTERPVRQGLNMLSGSCTVRVRATLYSGDIRLFGTVIERGGSFKFLTYSNDL